MDQFEVVLATQNRPRYLKTCLEGLRRQTVADISILVVDSASNDAARRENAQLAAEYGARFVALAESGLSRARNHGAALATAEWLAFLDDDAVPEPDWAACLIAALERLPADAAALGGRLLPKWEAPLPDWWPQSLRNVLTIIEWAGRGEIGFGTPPAVDIYGANMILRRAAMLQAGAFPTNLGRVGTILLSGEEAELLRRLRALGYRTFYDGSVVAWHSIQEARLRPEWLLQRLYWQGVTDGLRQRQGSYRWDKGLGRIMRLAIQRGLALVPATSPVLMRPRCGLAYNRGFRCGYFTAVPGAERPALPACEPAPIRPTATGN